MRKVKVAAIVLGVFVTMAACIVAGIVFGFSIVNNSMVPVDEALLKNWMYGNKAVYSCAQDGDTCLKKIWDKENGIQRLTYSSAPRLTSLLLRVDTPLSYAIAYNLASREVPVLAKTASENNASDEEPLLPICIGAYVLACKGMPLDSKCIESLKSMLNALDTDLSLDLPTALICLTLAYTHDQDFSTLYANRLPDILKDAYPSVLLDACGIRGDKSLIPALQGLMQTWQPTTDQKDNSLQDLGPRCLRALIMLESYDSIGIYMDRCSTVDAASGELLSVLNRLTGIQDPMTVKEWQDWYARQGQGFTLSATEQLLLHQEINEAAELWLYHPALSGPIPYKRTPLFFESISTLAMLSAN